MRKLKGNKKNKNTCDMKEALKEISKYMERIIKGDVEFEVTQDYKDIYLNEIAKQVNEIAKIQRKTFEDAMELALGVSDFLETLKKVSEGNLDVRVSESYKTETLSILAKYINNAIGTQKSYKEKLEEALEEISTPVLHAWDGIIVMPLIGTISSERALKAMEKLLTGVIDYKAKVAIIDITGVPVVDTMVASYLLRSVKAVKILGSEAIITGISAEIAATLVKLDIDIEALVTKNTLKEGLKYAIEMVEKR